MLNKLIIRNRGQFSKLDKLSAVFYFLNEQMITIYPTLATKAVHAIPDTHFA